jgi:hypothetical protein
MASQGFDIIRNQSTSNLLLELDALTSKPPLGVRLDTVKVGKNHVNRQTGANLACS